MENRFLIFIFCCLTMSGCDGVKAQTQSLKQRANSSVFRKLSTGINIDTSLPSSGVWPKVAYDVAQFQAAANAGFKSVRVFMPFRADIEEIEGQIIDALSNDLAIVLCMWGKSSWAKKDIEFGAEQIAKRWGELARVWKKYPSDLVFEILNEPKGIGYKREDRYDEVMKLYNAAVQAIRNEDPTRPILIGSPRSNDPEYLDPYVTEKYLTYTFDGGKGFYDDTHTGVAIHFYSPKHEDGINFAMWTAPLPVEDKKWKPIVLNKITTASKWRDRIGVNIPIVTTEWGCWSFPGRPDKEITEWLEYHMSNFIKYDIGNMWYTGIQNNQRSYAIFDSELGWNQTMLDQLTGVTAKTIPKTSQIINSEFHESGLAWHLTSDKITKEYIYGNEAFSGNSMLKIKVPQKTAGQLYQQSYKTGGEYIGAPGKTLLHLIKGQTYRISFVSASEDGKGRIKIMLKKAKNSDLIYDSYKADEGWINIGREAKKYTRLYTHSADDELDVRLEFDIGSKEQVLYLDKVDLRRN